MLESAPFFFTIKEPTGVDKAAFEEFENDPLRPEFRGKLLQQYPTSLYTAYAVLHAFDIHGAPPEIMLKQIETGAYFSDTVPDDSGQSPRGWRSLGRDDALAWREKWFNIIQTHHPGIWFMDRLKLRKALDLIALKHFEVAAADLRSIRKHADKLLSKRAQEYLSLIEGQRFH